MVEKYLFLIAIGDYCQPITSIERTKMTFFISRVEKDVTPPILSSEELYDMVS